MKHLEETIIEITRSPFRFKKIVAFASLGGELNLEEAVVILQEVMYESEQLASLIYKMKTKS